MKKRSVLYISVAGVFFAGVVFYALTLTTEKPLSIREISASYVADFTDDKALMGSAHNVFVGKVIAQIGTKSKQSIPETQFSVEVIKNIKGKLEGVLTVNQEGGYKGGTLYVMEGGNMGGGNKGTEDNPYLLQPGSTYLFTTRHSPTEDWHTVNPFYTARKLISTDKSLSIATLRALVGNDSRVQELKVAYLDETLLKADIVNNNALNSFVSLSSEEQGRLKAEVE